MPSSPKAFVAALIFATLVSQAFAQVETTFAIDAGGAIQDDTETTFTFTVPVSFTLTGARLRLALSHEFITDIDARLRSPSGTVVHLFELIGGDGPKNTFLADVVFRDDASEDIGRSAQGNDPGTNAGPWVTDYRCQADQFFNGSSLPPQVFNAFAGEDAQGTWQLMVRDHESGDTGYVYASGDDTSAYPLWGSTMGTAITFLSGAPVFSPLQEWRLEHFGTPLSSGAAANEFDAEKDDSGNLLEYALDRDPQSGVGFDGTAGLPSGGFDSTHNRLVIEMNLPSPTPAEVLYEIRASSNLNGWATIAEKMGTGSWTDNGSGAVIVEGTVMSGRQIVQVRDVVTGATRRMLQLRVTEIP